jgi:type I restriction enzyme R subunit
MTNIIENYAQIVVDKNKKTGQKTRKQIFPRYHQLNLVRSLLDDVQERGAGRRYLLQYSAGSGRSNSIAWLAHQLIGLRGDPLRSLADASGCDDPNPTRERGTSSNPNPTRERGTDGDLIFDTVIVITDRRILDQQIDATIRQFMQVGSTVGHAKRSGDLRKFIESGKKIIISTVQKFPFILDEIGDSHRGRKFALIIDEGHLSTS